MEQVSYDHIVVRIRSANKAPRIGGEKLQLRLAVRREVVRLELRHNFDDFRDEFHAVALQVWIQCRSAERDAGAQAEKQSLSRRRMQQQRDVRMAIFRR